MHLTCIILVLLHYLFNVFCYADIWFLHHHDKDMCNELCMYNHVHMFPPYTNFIHFENCCQITDQKSMHYIYTHIQHIIIYIYIYIYTYTYKYILCNKYIERANSQLAIYTDIHMFPPYPNFIHFDKLLLHSRSKERTFNPTFKCIHQLCLLSGREGKQNWPGLGYFPFALVF